MNLPPGFDFVCDSIRMTYLTVSTQPFLTSRDSSGQNLSGNGTKTRTTETKTHI